MACTVILKHVSIYLSPALPLILNDDIKCNCTINVILAGVTYLSTG